MSGREAMMSISLRQLSAMADIADALASEMRELIVLRQIVAAQSAKQLQTANPTCVPHQASKSHPKPISRIARAKSGSRSPVSVDPR